MISELNFWNCFSIRSASNLESCNPVGGLITEALRVSQIITVDLTFFAHDWKLFWLIYLEHHSCDQVHSRGFLRGMFNTERKFISLSVCFVEWTSRQRDSITPGKHFYAQGKVSMHLKSCCRFQAFKILIIYYMIIATASFPTKTTKLSLKEFDAEYCTRLCLYTPLPPLGPTVLYP